MFDAVRNNKRIVQVFLALITLPFAFFGVESYVRNAGTGDDVARIGDVKITQQQFQQAMRDQQERLRTQMGAQFDAKMLDTPEARKTILDDLVDQQLLMLEANKKGLFASDEAIRRTIGAIDAFKVDGKFSPERYEAALRGSGHDAGRFRGAPAPGPDPAATRHRCQPVGRDGAHGQRPHPGHADREARHSGIPPAARRLSRQGQAGRWRGQEVLRREQQAVRDAGAGQG